MKINHRITSQQKRQARVRAKVRGTSARPRVQVSRSNKHIYVQIIDDQQGKTIAAARTSQVETKGTKTERAKAVAELLSATLQKLKVKQLVFDRGQYRYHGRVKTVAETLRAQGLEL